MLQRLLLGRHIARLPISFHRQKILKPQELGNVVKNGPKGDCGNAHEN